MNKLKTYCLGLDQSGNIDIVRDSDSRKTVDNGLAVAKYLMKQFGYYPREAQVVKGIIHENMFFPHQSNPNSHVLMIFDVAIIPVEESGQEKWIVAYPDKIDFRTVNIGHELRPSFTDGTSTVMVNNIDKNVAEPTTLLEAILLVFEYCMISDFSVSYEDLLAKLPREDLVQNDDWTRFLKEYLYPTYVELVDCFPYLVHMKGAFKPPKLDVTWEVLTVEFPFLKLTHTKDAWTVFVRNSGKDEWVSTGERSLYSDSIWKRYFEGKDDEVNITFHIQKAVYALSHLKRQDAMNHLKGLLAVQ